MGELLQVDLDRLRSLGASLADLSCSIKSVNVSATVMMPGSPIAAACESATRATNDAYRHIGENVGQMSATCASNAATYEAVDAAFGSQFRQYQSEMPQ